MTQAGLAGNDANAAAGDTVPQLQGLGWSERLALKAGIIERISEGVLLVARDGLIRYANTVVEAMLGYRPGELLGVNSHVLSFRTREAFEGLLQSAFESTGNGSSALIDLEARCRDGTLLPVQGRFSSLMLGDTRYVVAVFTDISTRKQLEREMIQMTTRVQQRVGGDLHEGLGQDLSGIAMMLQGLTARVAAAGDGELEQELEQVVAQLNVAVRRTRLLARGLSPVRPSAEGITEGFEELVNSAQELYGQQVELSLELPSGLAVDENPLMNLFHIAQEAVENAAQHARASRIGLAFRVTGSEMELQVTDDGVGFDPAQVVPQGRGLRMMRFRAELARGYLLIESRPGHGARLRCRCPARTDRHT